VTTPAEKTVKVRDLLGAAESEFDIPQYKVREIVNRLRAEGKVEPVASGPQNAHMVTEDEKALILEACESSPHRRDRPTDGGSDDGVIDSVQKLADEEGPTPTATGENGDGSEGSGDSEKPGNRAKGSPKLGWILGVGGLLGLGGLVLWLLMKKKRQQRSSPGKEEPSADDGGFHVPTEAELIAEYRQEIARRAAQ